MKNKMNNDDIRNKQFGDWPISQEWLVELGRISALWASLESFVTITIGKLAGFDEFADPKPFILVAHSNFHQRLDMIGALCEHLLPIYPELEGYEKVISQLKTAKTKRNRFVHNGLHPSDTPGKMQTGRGSARGSLKFTVEEVDLADLKRTVIDINEASQALMNLVFKTDYIPKWRRETEQSAQEGSSTAAGSPPGNTTSENGSPADEKSPPNLK
jgi:hypothetical protein